MPSPFPGMDPYIEGQGWWAGFHTKLIGAMYIEIANRLPEGFIADIGERSHIVLAEEEGKETYPFVPDVKVLSHDKGPVGKQQAIAIAEPMTGDEVMTMEVVLTEEVRQNFIEIYERNPETNDEEMLVTTVEILSPSNKRPGSDSWRQYQRKRQSILFCKTNLVEIDLLRLGTRMPMRTPWPNSPYTILVCRGESAPTCKVYRAHYRAQLPVIPIPLRPAHTDLQLELQPMIESLYRLARYDARIKYNNPLDPPLPPDDAAWLAETIGSTQ